MRHCWNGINSNKNIVHWVYNHLLYAFQENLFEICFRNESLFVDDMTDPNNCNVDDSNTLTFKIILMMGIVFVGISALISLYIDRVDRKKLLSEISNVLSTISKSQNFLMMRYAFYVFQLVGYGCVHYFRCQ